MSEDKKGKSGYKVAGCHGTRYWPREYCPIKKCNCALVRVCKIDHPNSCVKTESQEQGEDEDVKFC